MISRKIFKDVINFIQRISELDDKVHDLYKEFSDILIDGYGPFIDTSVITNMLNECFNLEITEEYGSDLDFWLWECNFGKEWNKREVENLYLPEDHKYRKPKINNLDELYDYLVWLYKESKEGNKNND